MSSAEQIKNLINHFKQSRFLVQIILDGYGIGKKDFSNAIFQAKTPYMDYLLKSYANTELFTHGQFVGLPEKNSLGSSEIGHSTIGAGKINLQLPSLIQKKIIDGSFAKNPVLLKLFRHAKKNSLHLIGLLSDGNIHSHIYHLETILSEAAKNGVSRCYLHALLDGRDVAVQSALHYTKKIQMLFQKITRENPSFEYAFASAGGREYTTMDRAKNWYLVQRGWAAHVRGEAEFVFDSIEEGIQYFRKKNPQIVDQDIPAFNIRNSSNQKKDKQTAKKTVAMQDGDAVFFFNFRADRAAEFSSALEDENFSEFPTPNKPDVYFAAMCVYNQDKNTPKNRIIEPPAKGKFFGEWLVEKKITQFRLTETQKYPHVTFFYNGGYREPLDKKLETYHCIQSDAPHLFVQKPQMKAKEITAQAIKFIKSKDYSFGLINFPNPDMVGHTGDFQATKKAIEILDACLQKICKTITQEQGIAIITADHGNADEMVIQTADKKKQPSAKHSLNPVPFIILDKNYTNQYQLQKNSFKNPLTLANIAATSFVLLGEEPPESMDRHLFKKNL